MKLLLDTHLLLWLAFEPDRLSRAATRMIADESNELWFSVASLWAVATKRALGRANFLVEAEPLRGGLLANGYSELAIEARHVLGLGALPALQADPFDRVLVAQARAEGMILLTVDRQLAEYGGPVRRILPAPTLRKRLTNAAHDANWRRIVPDLAVRIDTGV